MNKVELLEDLNSLTAKWVKENDLFKGGCAYASAVLARELANAGIEYEVVAFNPDRLDPIASNESCKHMAITVKVGRKKLYIGGEPTLREKCRKTQLGKIAPQKLMSYYQRLKVRNKWNSSYKTRKNRIFSWLCSLARIKQEHTWLNPIFKAILRYRWTTQLSHFIS